MSKQEKLISAEKILGDMKQRVQGLLRSKETDNGVFLVVNALDNYINRIESGVYDVDPVPTIKPGDWVNHNGFQFPFLKGVKVEHLQIHRFGTYAVVEHDGETYTVPLDSLEVVKDE